MIDIEDAHLDAFDADDVRLLGAIADQVGSALRSALLYERLERAYLGTAEALAALWRRRTPTRRCTHARS